MGGADLDIVAADLEIIGADLKTVGADFEIVGADLKIVGADPGCSDPSRLTRRPKIAFVDARGEGRRPPRRTAPNKGGQSPVARIRRLETTEPVDDARAARDLLADRGVTEVELQRIEALLDASWQMPVSNAPTQEEILVERRAAEEAMWTWYLEWSGIVRATVTDRNVLRRIGFGGDAASYEPAEGDAALNVAA